MSETGERRYLVADPMAFAGGNYVDNEAAIAGLLTAIDPPVTPHGDTESDGELAEELNTNESHVNGDTRLSSDSSDGEETESDASTGALSAEPSEQEEDEKDDA